MPSQKPETPVVCLAYANERTPQGFLKQLTIELKSVMNALEPAVQKNRIHLRILPAATAQEIANIFQDEWYENRVSVFHYSGHADDDELWLETEQGENQSFFSLGLSRFLGAQQGVKLVFLNGCATLDHAELLMKSNVPAVIATSRKIEDLQARQFATFFYKGLASGASIKEAFEEAEGIMLGKYGERGVPATFGEGDSMHRSLFWEDASDESYKLPWRLFLREGNSWMAAQWRLFHEAMVAEEEEGLSAEAFINETINNYRIVEFLGEGSTGLVFKAIHINLNTEVALKLTHRAITGYEQLKQIVFSGNKGLSAIEHPNVVDFMDVGEVLLYGQKRIYIVMELVKGRSLDKLDLGISMLDKRAIKKLASFGLQLCDAVKAVHETKYVDETGQIREGIVHGNIKTRKIMVTHEGVPKLIDFVFTDLRQNMQIKLDVPESIRARDRSERLEDYFPPEVIRGEVQVNEQTDIYSLGAVFVEVFIGKRLGDLSFSSVNELHELFDDKNRRFPKKFTRVIYNALHPDPQQRYQKMSEMIDDLLKNQTLLDRLIYWFKRK